MKYILLFACLLFANKNFAQAKENIQLVNKFFDAINAYDTTLLKTFCDDSVHIQSPNWEGTQIGTHALAVVYYRYFTGTPDIKYSITNIISCDTSVVVEFIFSGKFSNPEEGTPGYMRNKNYSIKGISRIDITANKIKNIVTYFDQVSFLRQVGFFDQKN